MNKHHKTWNDLQVRKWQKAQETIKELFSVESATKDTSVSGLLMEMDKEVFEATKRAMKEPRNDDNGIKAQKELI